MKRLNFNIKDRKVLYMILGITFISVFTLTVAYAALSTVLNISGSAQVSSAEWNVHFDNVKVINGSVSGDDPRITSPTTATFSTVLNMPGDFYEFTIDVVNNGSIDAMIENITKTPTLSSEQAKYLKYDITYQNGESITTKQLVEKNSFVRLKVRLEYRSDITASDLPKTSETLNLGLKLDYIQSDGSGSVVSGNGQMVNISVEGNINDFASVVTIGTEQFYVIGTEGNNVKLFSKYNLMVGNQVNALQSGQVQPPGYTGLNIDLLAVEMTNPTGLQNSLSRGYVIDEYRENVLPWYGTVPYSTNEHSGVNYNDYHGSVIEKYVNNYKLLLEKMGVTILEARIITMEELTDPNTFSCANNGCKSSPYLWAYSTSYWTSTPVDSPRRARAIFSDGTSYDGYYNYNDLFGVRPVIVISKDYFPRKVISFNIAGVSYQADDGMTWSEWIDSEYNIDGYEKDFISNLVVNKDGYNINSVALKDVIVSEKNYTVSNSRPPV